MLYDRGNLFRGGKTDIMKGNFFQKKCFWVFPVVVCVFFQYLGMVYWMNAADCILGSMIFLAELFCFYRLIWGKFSEVILFALMGFNQLALLLALILFDMSGKHIAYAVVLCLLFALCECGLAICRKREEKSRVSVNVEGEKCPNLANKGQQRFACVLLIIVLLGGCLAFTFRFMPKNVLEITKVTQEDVVRIKITVVYTNRQMLDWEISGKEQLTIVFEELEQISCRYRPTRLNGQLQKSEKDARISAVMLDFLDENHRGVRLVLQGKTAYCTPQPSRFGWLDDAYQIPNSGEAFLERLEMLAKQYGTQ